MISNDILRKLTDFVLLNACSVSTTGLYNDKVSLNELFAAQKEQSAALQRYYNAVRDAWTSYFSMRKETLYDFTNEIELEDLFLKTIYKKSLLSDKNILKN